MQALSYRYFCDGGPVQPYRILYSHTGGEQHSLHRAKDAPSEPVEDAAQLTSGPILSFASTVGSTSLLSWRKHSLAQ